MSSLSVMVCGRHETGAAQAQMPHRQKAGGDSKTRKQGTFSVMYIIYHFLKIKLEQLNLNFHGYFRLGHG